MPPHKLHLTIAKRISDRFKLDTDSVLLGSVMPDLCIDKDHSISHYQNGKLGVKGVANPDIFVKKYKDKLNNPVMIGYLIHLLTDQFFNTYMFENYFIYDKKGNEIGLHFKKKDKLLPPDKIKYYKHREFDLYDKWLLTHKWVPEFNGFSCLNKLIDIEEAKFDKKELKKYIIKHNKTLSKVNIFSRINISIYKLTSKSQLDRQFGLCYNYIYDYIKFM